MNGNLPSLRCERQRTSSNISTRGLWLGLSVPLLVSPVLHSQSLYCSRVTQPCHQKPSAISAATSLLFSLSSSSRCYPSVVSWCRAHIDSNDEILKSGLSSPFTVLSLLDLNAKNGSEANLWLRWLWPLICDPLCLCLWNMACFLHLICRQMDNMVWRGLFRRLLFPAQSMMEGNYQECWMKPWGQRPFPPCYE